MWFLQYPASAEAKAAKRTQHKDKDYLLSLFYKAWAEHSLTLLLIPSLALSQPMGRRWGHLPLVQLCKSCFPLWPARDWRQVTAARDSSCAVHLQLVQDPGGLKRPYCANPWDSLARIPKARGHPMESENEDMGEKWNKWGTAHQELLAPLLGWRWHHPHLTLLRTRGTPAEFTPLPVWILTAIQHQYIFTVTQNINTNSVQC